MPHRFCRRWAAPIAADLRYRQPRRGGELLPRGGLFPPGGAARAAAGGRSHDSSHLPRQEHPPNQGRAAAPAIAAPCPPLSADMTSRSRRNRPQSTPTTGHARNQAGTKAAAAVAPRGGDERGAALARAPGESRAAARRCRTTRDRRSTRDSRCRSPSERRRGCRRFARPASSERSGAPSRGRRSTGFRVIHFSIQQDHGHFIVEGDEARRARGGMHGLAIRLALAVNRALGRKGQVVGDRYHARPLTTPRQMRTAWSTCCSTSASTSARPRASTRAARGRTFRGGSARPRSQTRPRRRRRRSRGWRASAGDARAGRCGSRNTPPRRRDRTQLESADVPPADGAQLESADVASARAPRRDRVAASKM